jgi:nucleotide sugar dehydrogenase
LNSKTFNSDEPGVNELLLESKNFTATTSYADALKNDMIYIVVATPSLDDGSYDHSQVESTVENLLKFGIQDEPKHLIICCTVMPGYCDSLYEKVKEFNYTVSYNPEFIAQGTIIRDQLRPDMILIGEHDETVGDRIVNHYSNLCENTPRYSRMNRTEAEITKIALNCFLTTKIAYANMVGDVAINAGCDPDKILSAIGSDSRIGNKYLRYGFGFGGPCFPRDNRSFAYFARNVKVEPYISIATDQSNNHHLQQQADRWETLLKKDNTGVTMGPVTYKPESTMLVESQQLKLAVELADRGFNVCIQERSSVIEELKKTYGEKFEYKISENI